MLKARNRDLLKFAILWANLDWRNQYPPLERAKDYWDCACLYQQTYTLEDMDRITDYWLEHYLHQPNYWQLRGQPVVQIFDVDHLLKSFPQAELRRVLDRMRERCVKGGLPGLHLQTCGYVAGKTPLKELGFDSATTYHAFDRKFGEFKIDTYATGVRQSFANMETNAQKTLQFRFFRIALLGGTTVPASGKRRMSTLAEPPISTSACWKARSDFLRKRLN